MSSALVISILDKVRNMKFLCQQYRKFEDYEELVKVVQAFYDIIPPTLIIANKNKVDEVYWAKEVDVVLGNVVAMFHNLYSSVSKTTEDATLSTSLDLIQKDMTNYKQAISTYIKPTDHKMLRQFTGSLELHYMSSFECSYMGGVKYYPVLVLENDILSEKWVTE